MIEVMALMGIASAIQGANQAATEAQVQQIQHAEQEYQRRLQNQIENRNIAKTNAMKWMNNQKIAEAANKTRAENEYWLKYNFGNASGAHGRKTAQLNNHIVNTLYSRNINPQSGTARALLRTVTEDSKDKMVSMRVSHANQLIAQERKQEQALSGRDFGYNGQVMQTPGRYLGINPGDAFSASLGAGLTGVAMNVAATHYMGQQAAKG